VRDDGKGATAVQLFKQLWHLEYYAIESRVLYT
jgi:hypothetical protein